MYFTVVTDYGAAEIMKAASGGGKVSITEFAVGDGNGSGREPSAGQTALVNEVWRGAVSSCHMSADSENMIIAESVVPSGAGGFTIREMGIFDDKGGLIAVCSTPDTLKARVSDGVVHELVLSMEIALANAESVQLIVDPNVVTASKRDVEELRAAVAEQGAGIRAEMAEQGAGIRAEMELQGAEITDALNAHLDEAVRQAVAGVYRFLGSVEFAELPAEGMAEGDTYNVRDAFTTTEAFAEGAGKECPAGTNVAYSGSGWDCLGGIYDFSAFAMKSELADARGVTLQATLAANATSVSFTNAAITDTSIIDVYTDKFGVNPTAATVTGTTLKLTFDAQAAAVKVAVIARRCG